MQLRWLVCWTILLVCLYQLPQITSLQPKPTIRIGIIGGGLSGASSAHWLESLLGRQFDLQLTVYEREAQVGGRVQDIQINSHRLENGGTILHESNLYFKYFTRYLNLTKITPNRLEKTLGIWNGQEMVLELTGSIWYDIWTILWRYGWDYSRLSGAISRVAESFVNIYQKQDIGISYNSPQELLQALGLYSLTQRTFLDHFSDVVNDDLILAELGDASTRVNYGQSLSTINAFAGAIGLIPLTDSRLWQVEEGNSRVIEGLLQQAKADVRTEQQVWKVERKFAPTREYFIHSTNTKTKKNDTQSFDVVILATPLQLSDIEFKIPHPNFQSNPRQEFEEKVKLPHGQPFQTFQVTHTTWVRGALKPSAFSILDLKSGALKTPKRVPGMLLTTETSNVDFTSMTSYAEDPIDGLKTYKIFSRQPFTTELLNKYFDRIDHSSITRTPWSAYPHFNPPETFLPSFQLFPQGDEDVWYPLALESAASCLEIQAVATRNVAMKIADRRKERKRMGTIPIAREAPTAPSGGTRKLKEDL